MLSAFAITLVMFLGIAVAPGFTPAHASKDYERYHALASTQHASRDGQTALAGAYAIVAFSPNGGGTQLIVHAIDHARQTILVQAYSFSSRPIIRALESAKARGVGVYVILDHSDLRSPDSGLRAMLSHGIPVWIDTTVRI
ncbi:MAG: phospholipase D-like domain-containing protein, partial [Acidiferrobacteraceae bacterium]